VPPKAVRRLAHLATALSVAAVALVVPSPAKAVPLPVPDETWVTNGPVYAVAQAGGRIYLGGSFTQVGPNTGFGVRLDTASGAWTSGPKVNGPVYVAVPDGSGGWFIGGAFTRVNGVSRQYAARIDAAGNLLGWNPSLDAPVRAIAVDWSRNTAYIGGVFTTVRTTTARAGLASVNIYTGAPDPAWQADTSTGGSVAALALSSDGTRLYAGGVFTSLDGVARSNLAALNALTGTVDSAFNANVTGGAVNALALAPGATRLLVGGAFTGIGGLSRGFLAAVRTDTGAGDGSWGNAPNGAVLALSLSPDAARLYAGGSFTTVGATTRKRLAAMTAAAGTLDTAWNPTADADVTALSPAPDGTRLYIAGRFAQVDGTGRNFLAAVGSSGSGVLDPAWNPKAGEAALAVAASNSLVFAGGDFTTVNAVPRARLAALNATTGVLDPGFKADTDGTVRAIATTADGSAVYAGGLFKKVNGTTRTRLVKLNGTTGALDSTWHPAASGEVKTVALSGGRVYIGGLFTQLVGSTRNRAGAVDATTGALSSWNPNLSSAVYDLTASNDGSLVYLAGTFSTVGGVSRSRIAAVNASSGALLTSWKPVAKQPLRRVAVSADGSKVFVTVAGKAALGGNRVIAYDTTAGATKWQALADGDVVALAVDGSTVYAGGHFDNISGTTPTVCHHLMGLDAATGTLTGFCPAVFGSAGVWDLQAAGGTVLAGGDFKIVERTVAQGLARFH
jgi:trimeric autotransporter adhesin